MVQTAESFIEGKGIRVVAEAAKREPGAVRLWKFRNSIPRDAWPELMEAFPEELNLDVLRVFEANKHRRSPRRRRAA